MILLEYKELSPSYMGQLLSETSSEEIKDALSFISDWLGGRESFDQKTSGSTGSPKNIQISRSLMETSARQTLNYLGLKRGGTAMLCISTKYIGGKMVLVRALVNKMNIILSEPSSNPMDNYDIKGQEISLCSMVPLQVQTVLKKEGQGAFQNISTILIGGATIRTLLEKDLSEIQSTRFFHTYGMTETVSHIALREIGKAPVNTYTVLPGNAIQLSPDQTLEVNGPVTDNRWITTNDIIEQISDSQFLYLGRLDNVINSGGIKVNPERLESKLSETLQSLGYNEFIRSSAQDSSLGEIIILLIEGEATSSEKTILKSIADYAGLEQHTKPRRVYFIPSFVRTENGKIRRKETSRLITSP
jgi:O-succinylbenzoic acid--CoA ligase